MADLSTNMVCPRAKEAMLPCSIFLGLSQVTFQLLGGIFSNNMAKPTAFTPGRDPGHNVSQSTSKCGLFNLIHSDCNALSGN